MKNYAKNLELVNRKIERARLSYSAHHIVNLVAASKYVGVDEIAALQACGQRAFGENKVQDLKAKSESSALANLPLQWHFIGTLQENKINMLLDLRPTLFHSLDSVKLANALQKRLEARAQNGKIQNLKALLQINSSYEDSKSGVAPESAIEIYTQIAKTCPNIKLQGIMTIGANTDDLKAVAKSFQVAKDIFDKLQNLDSEVKTLSMGMSGDFELAIAHGANLVRIGSRLFQ